MFNSKKIEALEKRIKFLEKVTGHLEIPPKIKTSAQKKKRKITVLFTDGSTETVCGYDLCIYDPENFSCFRIQNKTKAVLYVNKPWVKLEAEYV